MINKIQHIAIILDKSASISSYRLNEAMRQDYNLNVNTLKTLSAANGIKTFLTTIECGGMVKVTAARQLIEYCHGERSYVAQGGSTPLFDSVGKAIEIFQGMNDAPDTETSFLVMAITDGEDNHRMYWNPQRLSKEIARLQATDKWTFAFRVPRGYKTALTRLGVPEDNILEWEQTAAGAQVSAEATVQAYQNYYQGRTRGVSSTNKFFSNLGHVTKATVKATLTEITNKVLIKRVTTGYKAVIKDFVEKEMGRAYYPGMAYYELVKPEKIQDHKQVIIVEKATGAVYGGQNARDLLGLPGYGEVKVYPGDHGNYTVFVQSKSVNRILPMNSHVLVWIG